MKEFGDIVRENVKRLQAYSCARAEFEGTNVALLDANENPFVYGTGRTVAFRIR